MDTNLQQIRSQYTPKLSPVLMEIGKLGFDTLESRPNKEVEEFFLHTLDIPFLKCSHTPSKTTPIKMGVVLSGGQAAGGHNVITGLFDALKKIHPDSQLIGFLNGPIGIIQNKTTLLEADLIDAYRNQGGFDLIGSGRDKIEKKEQFEKAYQTCQELNLDGLLVIGGDDSNTNAALLAEYFLDKGLKTKVVGAPKTIDGDLKNQWIETSFGFDTACKVYSEIIGNILRDCLSAKKYYYFIKLMGRSASHIALECALETHPNYTFISEEVFAKKKSLNELVQELVLLIEERSKKQKNYGVVLIPEGIIEFIPEFKLLIQELNRLLSKGEFHLEELSKESKSCFESLPEFIQQQLLLDRDPHGNVQVSKIEVDRLLISMVQSRLEKGVKFSAQPHFCGYEGRSAYPSNFDSDYCYNLGYVAALLIKEKKTGYIAAIQNLHRSTKYWEPLAIPLTSMMTIEERHGQNKPVIKKALVESSDPAFVHFVKHRAKWQLEDDYQFPGPIQFFGPEKVTERKTTTLVLNVLNRECLV